MFWDAHAHKERVREIAEVLPVIIREIELSDLLGERLYMKMQGLNENQGQHLTWPPA